MTKHDYVDVNEQTKWTWPPFAIDGQEECIYGIHYEAKGTARLTVYPDFYRTYTVAGSERQSVQVEDRMNTMCTELTEDWQPIYFEAFTKKDAVLLEIGIRLAGHGRVEFRNLCIVKGGFGEHAPLNGPPYLTWINSLSGNVEWEQKVSEALSSDAEVLPEDVVSYMNIPVSNLMALVPERRPFPFESGLSGAYMYRWDVRKPDVLTDLEGNTVEYSLLYSVSGCDEIPTPSGKIVSYAYHMTSEGKKIYLDKLMTTARIYYMWDAADRLAMYFRATGNEQAGIRAAAILHALAKAIPDWPIYGLPEWNIPDEQFMPADGYEYWFAWIGFKYWYTVGTRTLIGRLVHTYGELLEPQIWEEMTRITGKDARADVVGAILHTARMTLKYDAYYRNDPWKFYHNTIGLQVEVLAKAGLAIGCPELIHYAANKAKGAFRYNFMADGMFPESVSYLRDMALGLGDALKAIEGYSDPEGYSCQLDGSRFDQYAIREQIGNYDQALELLDRLRFPDGNLVTFHDTWAGSVYASGEWSEADDYVNPHRRDGTNALLLPEFGHAVHGLGSHPYMVEAHLHYSGKYNHGHSDMLNFILWANGDELVADLGYTHLGGYAVSAAAHNLVLVNGEDQYATDAGNLLAWHAQPGRTQVSQACDNGQAYPVTDLYRRTVISVPVSGRTNVILDIFEVSGGQRHEWMANGCADYSQNLGSSLSPYRMIDNLDEEGKAFIPLPAKKIHQSSIDPKLPYDQPGLQTNYYGAFRNVEVYHNDQPWTAAMSAAFPDGETGAGLGERAKSAETKPSLRLHWLSPLDGEVYLCDAPRNRYYHELQEIEEAMAAWPHHVMPKIIVRREGPNLRSTFASIWEPMIDVSEITSCSRLEEIDEEDGIGAVISADDVRAIILYRKPESETVLAAEGIRSNGSFTVVKQRESELEIDLMEGSVITCFGIQAEMDVWPSLRVTKVVTDEERPYLLATGESRHAAYPAAEDKQPHAGTFIHVMQTGSGSRWLPLTRIKQTDGDQFKLYLDRDPGLVYDHQRGQLQETFNPYRSLLGELNVRLPVWLHVQINKTAGAVTEIRVESSGAVRLTLDNETCPIAGVIELVVNGAQCEYEAKEIENNRRVIEILVG